MLLLQNLRLYYIKEVGQNEIIPIQEVITHPFAVLGEGFLGRDLPGIDGWRDDHFPRLIKFIIPSHTRFDKQAHQPYFQAVFKKFNTFESKISFDHRTSWHRQKTVVAN